MKKSRLLGAVFTCALLMCSLNARANLLTNGDFETGDLSGWSIALDPNGTLGSPGVVLFDTDGDTVDSNSAQFNAGQISYVSYVNNKDYTGGAIWQSFNTNGGLFDVGLDIASAASRKNFNGGLFSLVIDNTVLDQFDFGRILAGEVERSSLSGQINLSPGTHKISISIQRPFISKSDTPRQYVDNVIVSAVPIPAAIWLFGSGLLSLVCIARGKKAA